MSLFIKNLEELKKKDIAIAGGKGASLGEMINAKILVPPGFVVLASTFDKYLEETDLFQDIEAQLNKVNYKDINSIERVSVVIRDLIHDAPMPNDLEKEILTSYNKLKYNQHTPSLLEGLPAELERDGKGEVFVAVRSSATAEDSAVASWAGELESYLNTAEKTLLKNIKNCWSSLFTPRAILYRQENNLHKVQISVAVVVQDMVESEISGVAFTVHPITKDKGQMIIESVWGLGEAIVSGAVTPDSYVIDKNIWEIIDININSQSKMIVKKKSGGIKWIKVAAAGKNKQILDKQKIIKLAKLCAKIEGHYGFPQDIEWAYAKGKFYIVQSRPITTL